MTVYTDSFTGTDGDAPASPWIVDIHGTPGTGYFRIQSNTAEANQQANAYHAQTITYGSTNYAYVDAKIKITFNGTDAESYPALGFRMAGGTRGWAATFAEVNNGYCAYLDNLANTLNLQKQTGGTQVASWQSTGHVITGGASWWLRVLANGTSIKVKCWNDSGAEPTTGGADGNGFQISQTDSLYTTGLVGIRGQAQTSAIKTRFDDWYFDDGVAGGTVYNEDITTSIAGTTTLADQLDGYEAIVTSIAATTTLADQLDLYEAVATDIAATTTQVEQLDLYEPVLTTIAATTTEVDQLDAYEIVASTVSATTTLADQLLADEDATTSVLGTTSVTEQLDLYEALLTTINASTTLAEQLDLFEFVDTLINGTTQELSQLDMYEIAVVNVSVTTEVFDSLSSITVYDEDVITSIAATTEVLATLIMREDVLTTGTVTTTLVDQLNIYEAVESAIAAVMLVADQLMADEDVLTIINATTAVSEFLGLRVLGLFEGSEPRGFGVEWSMTASPIEGS